MRRRANRPIASSEIEVLRAALDRAPAPAARAHMAEQLADLWVIDGCECGCDSVDFKGPEGSERSTILADGIGTTPAGGTVGILVWGVGDQVTGLEVYDLGAGDDDIKLPVPESIRPWERGDA